MLKYLSYYTKCLFCSLAVTGQGLTRSRRGGKDGRSRSSKRTGQNIYFVKWGAPPANRIQTADKQLERFEKIGA